MKIFLNYIESTQLVCKCWWCHCLLCRIYHTLTFFDNIYNMSSHIIFFVQIDQNKQLLLTVPRSKGRYEFGVGLSTTDLNMNAWTFELFHLINWLAGELKFQFMNLKHEQPILEDERTEIYIYKKKLKWLLAFLGTV